MNSKKRGLKMTEFRCPECGSKHIKKITNEGRFMAIAPEDKYFCMDCYFSFSGREIEND